MEGVTGEMRRPPTLSDRTAAAVGHPPANLRRLLRLGDEDGDDENGASRAGHTLGSVLGFDKLPAARMAGPAPMPMPTPSRTLLDIIREEETAQGQLVPVPGAAPEGVGSGDEHPRMSWRSLKDRLLLRRMGSIPAARPAAEGPGRVSLMNLLEESDVGHAAGAADEAVARSKPTSTEPAAAAAAEEGGEYRCCVCMVRHKGAAFIPCGHTFCRVCSRELWVSRGNCPLCNGYILEILDIF